ncbi:MAG: hypothetical protein CEO40_161 [Parcubacteria group bacterium LiPW_72]|nr:MAG: hypothetical protein CEO40_161 [Parcubacteria group bacterium LiPW_72]
MSHKNRFHKNKSRKFRKTHHLLSAPAIQNKKVLESGIEEVQEETRIDELLKPEEEGRPGIRQEPRGKFKPEKKITNPVSLRSSLQDLRQAMYLSLGFTLFLIVLYVFKLKTNLFTLGVDYLYRAMRF